jgi:predicted house-cleaning noncanonical NTP pyrophosphatase (MazG superfamily)
MKKFNKLVRDRIPEIIVKKGSKCDYHIAENNEEFITKLHEKLREEVQEFEDNPSIEEMVDIMEVLESLSIYYGFEADEIDKEKKEKNEKRGGFKKRIILDSTD